ncbi:hypothetical protein OZX68_04385 [Streptococcaceae bacterium ESL0729]|nr:hypothetical protein OZX68_04385 [Streptococcaceae bacterium ESL0729]
MNGKYHLIVQKGNKFKFYWAPMDPEIKKDDYSNWGVAAVDLTWKVKNPSFIHLNTEPSDEEVKPRFQVLRFPTIEGEEYRSTYVLESYRTFAAVLAFKKGQKDFFWACG